MGVDRWNDPPSRCNCLFAEGICRVRVKVRRLCRHIALQHVPSSFRLPSFLFSTNIPPSSLFGFFLVSSSRISPSECVTAVVCLFSFSSLCTFTGLRDLRWTWTPKGSPSFLIPILRVFPRAGGFLEILNRMRELMRRYEECRMRKMTRHCERFIFLKLWRIHAVSHFF